MLVEEIVVKDKQDCNHQSRNPVCLERTQVTAGHLSSNGDLNLNTGLNVDDNLFDDFRWCVKATGIDQY